MLKTKKTVCALALVHSPEIIKSEATALFQAVLRLEVPPIRLVPAKRHRYPGNGY